MMSPTLIDAEVHSTRRASVSFLGDSEVLVALVVGFSIAQETLEVVSGFFEHGEREHEDERSDVGKQEAWVSGAHRL